MTQTEIALVKKSSPYAGALSHPVIGYREDGSTSIECSSEVNAALVADVVFIRRSLNGRRYIYRRITER
jgi:hypothetical protein